MQNAGSKKTLFDGLLPEEAELVRNLSSGESIFARKKVGVPEDVPLFTPGAGEQVFAVSGDTDSAASTRLSKYLINVQERRIAAKREKIDRLAGQMGFLFDFTYTMQNTPSLVQLLKLIVNDLGDAVRADAAFVTILDGDVVAMIENRNISIEHSLELMKHHPFLTAAAERRTVVVNALDGKTSIIAPLLAHDGIKGYIAFFRNATTENFNERDMQTISIVNAAFSPLLESKFLYDFISMTYVNTVKALASAIDAKDPYTHGHSFRVAKYAVMLAKVLGVQGEQLLFLEIAGYMHDIGKIGVRENVLTKPGRLTDDEFEEVKKHSVITRRILEPANLPDFIVRASAEHHERLDGSGYPYGLAGCEISLGGRIVAIADVFDALTSDRTYRARMTVEHACEILAEKIDVWYDRDTLFALFAVLRNDALREELLNINPDLSFEDLLAIPRFIAQLSSQFVRL